jgi:hypothetical protein
MADGDSGSGRQSTVAAPRARPLPGLPPCLHLPFMFPYRRQEAWSCHAGRPCRRDPCQHVEIYGSAGHHQVPMSMDSGQHVSVSIGRCGWGDDDAVARFESTASLSHAGGSTFYGKNWGRSVDSLTKLPPYFWTKVLQVINHAVIQMIRTCTHGVPVNTKKDNRVKEHLPW